MVNQLFAKNTGSMGSLLFPHASSRSESAALFSQPLPHHPLFLVFHLSTFNSLTSHPSPCPKPNTPPPLPYAYNYRAIPPPLRPGDRPFAPSWRSL